MIWGGSPSPRYSPWSLYWEYRALLPSHLNAIMLSHSADINVAIFHSHTHGDTHRGSIEVPSLIQNEIIPQLCDNLEKPSNFGSSLFLAFFSFFFEVDVSVLWPILLSETNCSLTDALCLTAAAAPRWESASGFFLAQSFVNDRLGLRRNVYSQ